MLTSSGGSARLALRLFRGRLRGRGPSVPTVLSMCGTVPWATENPCTFLCLQGLLLDLSQPLDQLVLLSLYPVLLLLRVLSFLLLVLQLGPEGSRGGKRDPMYFTSLKDADFF